MDIIAFFRNIDGLTYYLMLVINTILIFAIIGYLGEKNNEKYVKFETKPSPVNSNTSINSKPITISKSEPAKIPVVAPTLIDKQPVEKLTNSNPTQPSVSNLGVLDTVVNTTTNGNFVNNSNNNTNQIIPTNASVEEKKDDTKEAVPAVLVINSDNTNMPK